MMSGKRWIRHACVAMIGSLGATAWAQSTILVTSANSAGPIGDPGNTILTGLSPVTTAFQLGSGIQVSSATLTAVIPETWLVDFRMRIRNSAFPSTAFADVNFSGIQGFISPFLLAPTTRSWITNSIGAGASIPVSSTWRIEFYEDFDDDSGAGVDGTISNLSFTILGFAPPALSGSTSSIQSIDQEGAPVNPSFNLAPLATSQILGSAGTYSGTYTRLVTGDFPSDSALRIRSGAFPGLFANMVLAGTFGSVSSAVFTNQAATVWGPLTRVQLPAGTTLSVEMYNAIQDAADGIAEAQWNQLSFGISSGSIYTPPAQPTAIQVGGISTVTAPLANPLLVNSGPMPLVKWFRFAIEPISRSAGTFLDIYTLGSGLANSGVDSMLALYDSNGRLLASDDDGGDLDLSQLSFGAPSRPALLTGLPFIGQNGSQLAAGTYFLALSDFAANTTFSDGFTVMNPWGLSNSGYRVAFRTNGTSPLLTGQLTLQDTLAPFAAPRTIQISVRQGTTTLWSGSVIANTSVVPLSIPVPPDANGAAQVVLDGGSFLQRVVNVTLTGTGVVSGLTIAMQNGDSDNSGEVDAADIDAVIADFGGSGLNTDVDASGEVDAADIDIVIANFGGVND